MAEIYDYVAVQERIEQLHDNNLSIGIASTQTDLGLQDWLWGILDENRPIIEMVGPDDKATFDHFVGRHWANIGSYCSPLAATALAQHAFFQAFETSSARARDNYLDFAGLGVTTETSRLNAAIRTFKGIESVEVFSRNSVGKKERDVIFNLVGINLILQAVGIKQVPFNLESGADSAHFVEADGGLILRPEVAAPRSVDETKQSVLVNLDGTVSDLNLDPERHVIFPGAFRPLHFGHDRIAQTVRDHTGREPILEITGHNISKPPILGLAELAIRTVQMRGRWPVILTKGGARFIDKAAAYGSCSYALGYDTAHRVVHHDYYDPAKPEVAQAALEEFANKGIVFYIVGRRDASGRLRTMADLAIPEKHKNLFVQLPGDYAVSSSGIRKT